MRVRWFGLFLSMAVAFLLSSCSIFDGEPLEPAYLFIDTFSVTADPITQGSGTEKVQDGWVYINGQQLGVFQLPTTIPVLDTGMVEITVFGGVKENGLTGLSTIYPFYRGYELERQLVPFQTDTLTPAVTYQSGLSFLFLERFEIGNGFSVTSPGNVALSITTNPDEVLEGNRSAVALIDSTNYLRITTDPVTLPPVGQPVWAEIDYKCNTEFEFWLTGFYAGGVPVSSYMISVPPRDSWNKIYLNLGVKVQQFQADSYGLEIRALKNDSLDTGILYFDNIKIVAF